MKKEMTEYYLEAHTANGIFLREEINRLETSIHELEIFKITLLKKFAEDNQILKVGDRIEITWPNGITQVIDILTPGTAKIKDNNNEYDVVYGYRVPNKDGSVAKNGRMGNVWNCQLFVNGYKEIKKWG